MKPNRIDALALMTALASGLIATASTMAATPPAPTTTATAQAVAPTLREKIAASYFGIFAGPSVAHPLSSLQPDLEGNQDPTSPLKMINQVGLGYKLTDKITVGTLINFDYVPVQGMHEFVLNDPALRASHGSLFKTELMNLAGDVRADLPLSDASGKGNLITALRSTQVASFKVPSSRFNFSVATFEKLYVFGKQANEQHTLLRLYFAPSASYDITDKFSASALYELDGKYVTKKGWTYANPMALSFNLGYDVAPNMNVAPGVTVYPNDTISVPATQFNVVVSAKLL